MRHVPRVQQARRRGLPGGIAPPAVLFAVSIGTFMVCWLHPDLVDLGPYLSASGLGILGASIGLMWLLVAIGMRRPKDE